MTTKTIHANSQSQKPSSTLDVGVIRWLLGRFRNGCIDHNEYDGLVEHLHDCRRKVQVDLKEWRAEVLGEAAEAGKSYYRRQSKDDD
ncbi:hypothetical protein NECAME_05457 [Necator americanus]|uniref:Uncharacterized protein n=1 Tax=Necator americanus TaxID=51031 RepID=W2SGZ4_NECAM|nr:hypothetical protein NECAME_05457 [Necator americanus]ETN68865.1 hypothetical protein NECAME_05457 [Necator americanus]